MNDPRPRNNQGQFASQSIDGIDANTTSTAYNPQVIEQRKLSLIEKIRRMRGVRNGVEEAGPRQQQLSAKLRLRELAQRQSQEDPALGRAGSLLLAGGVGAVGNLAAVTVAKEVMDAKKQQGLDFFGQPRGSEMKPMMAWGRTKEEANEKLRKATEEVNGRNRKVQREYLRSNPDARRSEVLDRFARRKGYDIAVGDPGIAPKGAIPGKSRGIFQRGHADPDFIRAHEAGHVAQNLGGKNLPFNKSIRQAFMFAPLGATSALVNKDKSNDKVATGIAAAGTLAALPTLHNEVDASVRGYKIMRKLGSTRLRAAGAFVGLPTYAAIAAMPALGWGARKLRQARSEEKDGKQLSAKLRLRELARVAAQPYPEEERKGGIGKIGALGLGLGLGIGGAIGGARYLRPILKRGVGRASDSLASVAASAGNAIPKMTSEVEKTARSAQATAKAAQTAVIQASRNIDDATLVPRTMGKIARSEVFPRAWNIMNPRARWKEIKSGFDAGVEESRLRGKYIDRVRRRAAERGVSGLDQKMLRQAAIENVPTGTVPIFQAWRPSWARVTPERVKLAGPKAGAKLYSAKLRLRELSFASDALREFAEEKRPLTTKQKLGIAAGLGTAAVGATLMPAAGKMFRIATRDMAHDTLTGWAKKRGLRSFIKPPKSDPNRDGRFVADYIDGAQSILNKGVQGKIAGKILQHAKANPKGKVAKVVGGELGDYGVSHYARFRSGPREAMKHWDSEVGDLKNHIGKQQGILDANNNFVPGANPAKVKKTQARRDEMAAGRKAVDDEINEQLWHHGKSESEALRHVAENTKNPAALQYFKNLAHHNRGAAAKYAKISLVAPGMVVGGGATAGLSMRRKENQ
jgi:hypothetical protein